jgi:hypothetical protein
MIHQKILADYKRILNDTLRLRHVPTIPTSYRIVKRCVICDAEYDSATIEHKLKCVCSDRCRRDYRRIKRRERILQL